MKVDFGALMTGIAGQEIKITDAGVERPFTLRDVAVNALMDERAGKAEAEEKYGRGALADRIFGCKEPILISAEEVVLLKRLIGQTYGPLIVWRAWNILEGK